VRGINRGLFPKSLLPLIACAVMIARRSISTRKLFQTKRDREQDLIEYTLLMAVVALASASIFISVVGSIS
jgi:hypothetical protein